MSAANQLPISNVINVSVSQASPGLGAYNTSNLAIFSDEPVVQSVQTIVFSGVAASGSFVLSFNGNNTASIAWNASVQAIQADIAALSGMSSVVVSGSIASQSLSISWPGQNGSLPLASIISNSLQTSGSVAISITPTITNAGWSGGAAGYSSYLSPTQVGIDFGTSSRAYAMANAVFSQQPNILAGGGQLIIYLYANAVNTLSLSGIPASGSFEVTYNANNSAAINWNDSLATIQSKVQAVPGLSEAIVYGLLSSETLSIQMAGIYNPSALTISANTLATSAPISITISVVSSSYQSLASAISASENVVQYFGLMPSQSVAVIGQTDLLAAAAVVQPLNKIMFVISHTAADVQSGGMLQLIEASSYTQTRALFYDASANFADIIFMASYAGLGLSVNFNGSNTTITMNLKVLAGVAPDPSITQSIFNNCVSAGVDTYVSFQGVSGVNSTVANLPYDQVYNQLWLSGALQVAAFNYLQQANTKIPQTEIGMDGFKGALRQVMQQAVINGMSAAGSWNSPTTFGNQILFLQNILQVGYYIYSQPISQQLQTARVARQAPITQIAVKLAGAIQSASILVYVNA